ncbi:MAG: ABC transporter permease [Anaerolineae bacterium]|nr:ABC transporter permease [Anaerolineae bacterium]
MRVSLLILVTLLLVVTVGPTFVTDPMQTNTDIQFQPPNPEHILGTDLLGRDVLSRTLYGGRLTILIAVGATLFALLPGTMLGLLAGTSHSWIDQAIVTILNAFLAVPGLVVALIVLTLAGRGIFSLTLAVGLSQIAPCAFVVRAALLEVRNRLYVEAARGMGASPRFILGNHILPSIQPTLLAYTSVIFSFCVLNGAALNFLGLGGDPGVPEWGIMLAEGRSAFRSAPWIAFAPGLAITILVWTVNSLADHLTRLNTGE